MLKKKHYEAELASFHESSHASEVEATVDPVDTLEYIQSANVNSQQSGQNLQCPYITFGAS